MNLVIFIKKVFSKIPRVSAAGWVGLPRSSQEISTGGVPLSALTSAMPSYKGH